MLRLTSFAPQFHVVSAFQFVPASLFPSPPSLLMQYAVACAFPEEKKYYKIERWRNDELSVERRSPEFQMHCLEISNQNIWKVEAPGWVVCATIITAQQREWEEGELQPSFQFFGGMNAVMNAVDTNPSVAAFWWTSFRTQELLYNYNKSKNYNSCYILWIQFFAQLTANDSLKALLVLLDPLVTVLKELCHEIQPN